MSDSDVFALDIGTRTVIGLVVGYDQSNPRVKAAATAEHSERSMLDGQIHDVPGVAEVVLRVKGTLEQQLGQGLSEVNVAAAGRSLRTARGRVDVDVSLLEEITLEETVAVQVAAIQAAQERTREELRLEQYHCVGHSVGNFFLDGDPIRNPVGQRGKKLGVEVIATFLPRVVVDSLAAVLARVNLKMKGLTLEPIAAAQVLIPENMRQLNIAMVDVGAGTSDIAVCRGGNMIGYDMAPLAGDEFTEEICRQLLLDFAAGEAVKRQLGRKEEIAFKDVLGHHRKEQAATITAFMQPAVVTATKQIAEKIIAINGKNPQAVFLIGGGSLTCGLREELASRLELPLERVAVRGKEALPVAIGRIKGLEGAQLITPLGIALTTGFADVGFGYCEVNGHTVRVFQRESLTVSDVLHAAGVSGKELVGRPGAGLTVEANGEITVIKGRPGKRARVKLNGEEAGLKATVRNGDVLEFVPGQDGEPARAVVGDVAPDLVTTVFLDGLGIDISANLMVNGQPAVPGQPLRDHDVVVYTNRVTVAELLRLLPEDDDASTRIYLNGELASLQSLVKDGDVIHRQRPGKALRVTVNGEEMTMEVDDGLPIFSDIFKVMAFDPMPPEGKRELIMMVNGKKATFTTKIQPGDQLTLTWK